MSQQQKNPKRNIFCITVTNITRVEIYSLALEWCPRLCLLITVIWVLESCDLLCAALLSEEKQINLKHHIKAGRGIINLHQTYNCKILL